MRSLSLGLAAAIVCMTTGAATAAEDIYLGANVVRGTYSEDGLDDVNPTLVSIRLGRQINKNVAFEARVGVSAGDDSVTTSGIPVQVEIDNFFGVYARGILPVTSTVSLYGLLGYTHGKVTASAFGLSASTNDDDVSYGVGADFYLSKNVAINLEWARLFSGTGYDVSGIGAGASYKF